MTLVSAVPEDRFVELYEAYHPAVHRYVRSRIRDPQLAEDTVQETFVRVYRFLDRLDPDRPAWPWIKAIASGMCSNAVRGRRHQAEILVDDVAPVIDLRTNANAPIAPEEHCLVVEERRRVSGLLGRLPQRHRVVLVLKEVEQLSCAEIARIEGSSAETVKAVLARARAAFRRIHAAPAALLLHRRIRNRVSSVPATGLLQVGGLGERLVPAAGALLVAASSWAGTPAVARPAPAPVAPAAAPTSVPAPSDGVTAQDTSTSVVQDAPAVPTARLSIAVSPTASTAAGAQVPRDGDPEEEMTLDGELWARLGEEQPYVSNEGSVKCDGEVRRHGCDVVSTLPSP